jgi:hypothetical protein
MGKPAPMKQSTWDYLTKFTDHHEAMVLHMYNNRTSLKARQDVTCGVGFLLTSPDAAIANYKSLFYDPVTNQPAKDDQIRADWQAAADLLRTGYPRSNLESTPDGKGYADVCKLRMYPDKVIAKRNDLLGSKLETALRQVPELLQFYEYPAQAQVAIASYCYGFSPKGSPNFYMELFHWRFDEAGRESGLAGLSPLKVLDHRILFWNAARIREQKLDMDLLPLSAQKPAKLLWKPWTNGYGVRVEWPPIEPSAQ